MKSPTVKIRSTHDAVESAIDLAKKSAGKNTWGALIRGIHKRIRPWALDRRLPEADFEEHEPIIRK